MLKPTSLRCEHRTDAPCIDDPAPRLGWTLGAESRGAIQTAYRVLVSENAADLDDERGSLWDSSVVQSGCSVDVPYGGHELPAGAEITWTVRVWDEHGDPSPWSPPARFRTGLRTWRADWIGRDRAHDAGVEVPSEETRGKDAARLGLSPPAYLRREFEISGPVERAVLYATARGVAEFHVNGERVGDAVLAPGWTDYRHRIEYAAHDVTSLVRAGANALGAILGDGWYAGYVGFDPKRRAAHYGTDAELLCELHVHHADGAVSVIASDGQWVSNAGPIVYSDLLMGESYDARRERRLGDWASPGYESAGWSPVRGRPRDDVRLVPERGQPIRVTQELAPVEVTERESGVHIYDLGQKPHFTFHGFRYVEATGLPPGSRPEAITGCVVHSDTPPSATFQCSEELVNQLWRNITWGQRGNFLSVPTDCPQRDERLGWLADAQVFLPTATLSMDVAAFITKWGDDVLDVESPDGAYPDVAPRLVADRDGAPAWADAGVIVPWVIYQRYGDRRLLARHWDAMERYMSHLLAHNPHLLWTERRNNDYGDWLSVGADTPKEVLATAYWAHDASLMSSIAGVLGKAERAAYYARLREGIVRAFNDAYVGEDAFIIGDTQTVYLLALHMRLLAPELRGRAAERLVSDIERHDWHLTTGFVGVGLLCPVLTEAGYPDLAHRLLLNEYVAGIRTDPERPAYEHVIIAPVPGELEAACATYTSVRGPITSAWKQTEGTFGLEVDIPANVTATVILPPGEGALSEGGADAALGDGVGEVAVRDGRWTIEVASGRYRFELERSRSGQEAEIRSGVA